MRVITVGMVVVVRCAVTDSVVVVLFTLMVGASMQVSFQKLQYFWIFLFLLSALAMLLDVVLQV